MMMKISENVLEISHLVCTYPTRLPGGTGERRLGGGHALVSAYQGAQNMDYPIINSANVHRMITAFTMHARSRRTDRQTNEYHGHSATIRSNERIAR